MSYISASSMKEICPDAFRIEYQGVTAAGPLP
ncbi:Uncharacterised protein [Chlamydia trachomatis]|nr:Uncharacterised protein [Chlamydia trachomatis]